MDDLKNYIFFVITKEYSYLYTKGYSYGVLRSRRNLSHDDYLRRLRDIDTYVFENIPYSSDWVVTVEKLTEEGNIVIVNTAIEIEKVEDRMYGIYLPSLPTKYQVSELRRHIKEFENVSIDIGLYGKNRNWFLNCANQKDYNSFDFLNKYLEFYETQYALNIEHKNKIYQKK